MLGKALGARPCPGLGAGEQEGLITAVPGTWEDSGSSSCSGLPGPHDPGVAAAGAGDRSHPRSRRASSSGWVWGHGAPWCELWVRGRTRPTSANTITTSQHIWRAQTPARLRSTVPCMVLRLLVAHPGTHTLHSLCLLWLTAPQPAACAASTLLRSVWPLPLPAQILGSPATITLQAPTFHLLRAQP